MNPKDTDRFGVYRISKKSYPALFISIHPLISIGGWFMNRLRQLLLFSFIKCLIISRILDQVRVGNDLKIRNREYLPCGVIGCRMVPPSTCDEIPKIGSNPFAFFLQNFSALTIQIVYVIIWKSVPFFV